MKLERLPEVLASELCDLGRTTEGAKLLGRVVGLRRDLEDRDEVAPTLRSFELGNEHPRRLHAVRRVGIGDDLFERVHHALVTRLVLEHLRVRVDRALHVACLGPQDLAHAEAQIGARALVFRALELHLEDLEEVVETFGLLVETRERRERGVVGPEARERVVVGDDRVLGVVELRLVDLGDPRRDRVARPLRG
ncbi:MAG: hypothetical protein H6722_23415 [Sandaracinus sp.]|nr:hypothetical protein [Sandaracinus sp.]